MKVKHTTVVRAPVAEVRDLVADVRWWPLSAAVGRAASTAAAHSRTGTRRG
ncbi:hypothetical protein ACWD25_08410 [Streptomyces sp. NPDC002920]